MTMNRTSATASATDETWMGRTEYTPLTVEDNVISYSTNEPLLLCLPVAQSQASTVSLPGNKKKTLRASIPTEEGPTKKKETLVQESPTQVRGAPTKEDPATNIDVAKQKATHATFSNRLQCPSIEESPDQEADMPTKEASEIKKNVVLEFATQGADLPVEGTVTEKGDDPMPESPVQNFADMPTIEEPRKKRACEAGEATATKKKSKRRRKQYTGDEQNRLVQAMSGQPVKNINWELVKQNFEAFAPPGAPYRTAESLRSFHQRPLQGKNKTNDEQTRLLNTAGDVRPTKLAGWEIVKQNFEVAASPGAPYRPAKKLREKFDDLCTASAQKRMAGEIQPDGMRPTETVESVIEKRRVPDTDLITGEEGTKTKDSDLIEESIARATQLPEEGNPTKEKAAHNIEKSPAKEAGGPREEDRNARKRDIQELGEEKLPPKEQRHQGMAKPYTKDEKERLLDAVANVKPTLSGTWYQVKQHFDENAPSDLPSDAPTRSYISLRNKFSNIATSMIIDALAGKPLSMNLTGNPLGAETLTSNSKPADNDAVGNTPVYADSAIEKPVGDESFCSDPRRASMDRPLEVCTGIVDAKSLSFSSNGTKSEPPEAVEAPSDDDAMDEEVKRLSDAMISFFERFSADEDVIMGNECRHAIISRLDNIERNMKTVNSKVEMILSSVQSQKALERDKQWIL